MTATFCPHCGAEHNPDVSPCRESLSGRTLDGGIRLRGRLGEVPLGSLYRGQYLNGAEVEVLILRPSSADPATLDRLRQRFSHAARIRHLNVAGVEELSQTADGLVYLVAQRLTGELLSEALNRRGALPVEDALDLCLQAAAGLQAAHQAQWFHGRLSPDTILLTQPVGGRPVVKLIGFDHGFLRGQTGPVPAIQGLGSQYASPERIAGEPPDERSDVYSLGAVLHHLITGAPPTSGSQDGRIPVVLRAALKRALAPKPVLRFQTVGEFAAALRSAQVELSQRLPVPVRAGGRRHLVVQAVAIGLVGLACGLWLLGETHRSVAAVPAQPRPQESAWVVESGSSFAEAPVRARPAAPRPKRFRSAAAHNPPDAGLTPPVAAGERDSSPRVPPVERNSSPPVAAVERDSSPRVAAVERDSSPPPIKLSPFLRSRPWLAVEGERFYYSRSCVVQLGSRQLVFFTSEAQARARGFQRRPGCPAAWGTP